MLSTVSQWSVCNTNVLTNWCRRSVNVSELLLSRTLSTKHQSLADNTTQQADYDLHIDLVSMPVTWPDPLTASAQIINKTNMYSFIQQLGLSTSTQTAFDIAHCSKTIMGMYVWLGSLMVSVSAYWLQGHVFDFRPFHCQVTTLGKLFTHVPLSPSSIIWLVLVYTAAKVMAAYGEVWPTAHITELCLQLSVGLRHVSKDEHQPQDHRAVIEYADNGRTSPFKKLHKIQVIAWKCNFLSYRNYCKIKLKELKTEWQGTNLLRPT